MNSRDLERFMSFVSKVPEENGCWYWAGATSGNSADGRGYGYFSLDGKPQRAHRVSFEHFNGPLNDLDCCHKCDHTRCVNPNHLFAGTEKDNLDDMASKGRRGYTGSQGTKHHAAKLSEEQVLQIRELGRKGLTSYRISKVFGLNKGTIHKILTRENWAHI